MGPKSKGEGAAAPSGDKKPEEMKFEEALEALEAVVARLESGERSLEDAVRDFESGMRLVKACSTRLDEAERRVEILVGDEAKPFEPAEEEGS